MPESENPFKGDWVHAGKVVLATLQVFCIALALFDLALVYYRAQ